MNKFGFLYVFLSFLGAGVLFMGGVNATVINNGSISASFTSITVSPASSESSFVAWSLKCENNSTFYATPTSPGVSDPASNTTSDGSTASTSSSAGGGDLQSECDSSQGGQVDLSGSLTISGDGEGGETGGRARSEKTIALVDDATVTFTLDYTYDLVLTTAKDGETAEGFVNLMLAINNSPLDIDIFGTGLTVVRDGADFRHEDRTGTLSVSGNFQGGQEVKFEIDAALHLRGTIEESNGNGDDEVPEPGSLFLFGVGLVGLSGLRVRRLSRYREERQ